MLQIPFMSACEPGELNPRPTKQQRSLQRVRATQVRINTPIVALRQKSSSKRDGE